MLLLKHHLFVGSELNNVSFQTAILSPVETMARQVLNDETDITDSEDVRAGAMVYLDALERTATRWWEFFSDATPELFPTQTFR